MMSMSPDFDRSVSPVLARAEADEGRRRTRKKGRRRTAHCKEATAVAEETATAVRAPAVAAAAGKKRPKPAAMAASAASGWLLPPPPARPRTMGDAQQSAGPAVAVQAKSRPAVAARSSKHAGAGGHTASNPAVAVEAARPAVAVRSRRASPLRNRTVALAAVAERPSRDSASSNAKTAARPAVAVQAATPAVAVQVSSDRRPPAVAVQAATPSDAAITKRAPAVAVASRGHKRPATHDANQPLREQAKVAAGGYQQPKAVAPRAGHDLKSQKKAVMAGRAARVAARRPEGVTPQNKEDPAAVAVQIQGVKGLDYEKDRAKSQSQGVEDLDYEEEADESSYTYDEEADVSSYTYEEEIWEQPEPAAVAVVEVSQRRPPWSRQGHRESREHCSPSKRRCVRSPSPLRRSRSRPREHCSAWKRRCVRSPSPLRRSRSRPRSRRASTPPWRLRPSDSPERSSQRSLPRLRRPRDPQDSEDSRDSRQPLRSPTRVVSVHMQPPARDVRRIRLQPAFFPPHASSWALETDGCYWPGNTSFMGIMPHGMVEHLSWYSVGICISRVPADLDPGRIPRAIWLEQATTDRQFVIGVVGSPRALAEVVQLTQRTLSLSSALPAGLVVFEVAFKAEFYGGRRCKIAVITCNMDWDKAYTAVAVADLKHVGVDIVFVKGETEQLRSIVRALEEKVGDVRMKTLHSDTAIVVFASTGPDNVATHVNKLSQWRNVFSAAWFNRMRDTRSAAGKRNRKARSHNRHK